jgi:hypothetical protein
MASARTKMTIVMITAHLVASCCAAAWLLTVVHGMKRQVSSGWLGHLYGEPDVASRAELETLLAEHNERSAHLTAKNITAAREQLGRRDHWTTPRYGRRARGVVHSLWG